MSGIDSLQNPSHVARTLELSETMRNAHFFNTLTAATLVLIGCLLMITAGCSNELLKVAGTVNSSGSAPVLEDNWLSEELRVIPADYGGKFLRFANLKASKEAFGASDFTGIESFSGGKAFPEDAFRVLVVNMPGRDYTGRIYEETGIDLWGFDSILWTGEPRIHTDSPYITVIRGGFESEVGARLERLEYESVSHQGVNWYYAWTGPGPEFQKLRASPFSTDASKLNAIAPAGDRLLIRRWTDNMQSQIDVYRGTQPSLWDEKPYRELAQAIGSELLAGAFVTSSNVRELWSTFDYNLSPRRLPGFAPGSESWGTLEEYSLAIVGYRVMDDKEYSTIALHYADPDGAERNATEFEHRLKTAQLYLYNAGVNVPVGSDESFHYPPIASICERLEVETVEYAEFSVLVADCEARADDAELDGFNGLSATTLWKQVLYFGTLHFLVPDFKDERPWWQIF